MAKPFEDLDKTPNFRMTKNFHNFCQSFGKFGETQKTEGQTYPLFKKYTHIFTLCSSIGYFIGVKTPLEGKIESPFTLEQLDTQTEWTTLISIAWADSKKDNSIFMDSKTIIKICEEYAETGFKFLLESHPFNKVFVDNCLYNPEKIDLEFQVMLLIKELKDEFSKAIA